MGFWLLVHGVGMGASPIAADEVSVYIGSFIKCNGFSLSTIALAQEQ